MMSQDDEFSGRVVGVALVLCAVALLTGIAAALLLPPLLRGGV